VESLPGSTPFFPSLLAESVSEKRGRKERLTKVEDDLLPEIRVEVDETTFLRILLAVDLEGEPRLLDGGSEVTEKEERVSIEAREGGVSSEKKERPKREESERRTSIIRQSSLRYQKARISRPFFLLRSD